MTFREKLKTERRWNKRAIIVNFYHNSQLLKDKKWSQRKTAKRLGISFGAVCESIKLAQAMLNEAQIEECKTREEALQWLKNNGR